MTKQTLAVLALLATSGCTSFSTISDRVRYDGNPYTEAPFYSRYLNPSNALDRQIQAKVEGLRATPDSAPLHNDLGVLLQSKGFPKDARREFERAVASDDDYYPAWYNLGLMRDAAGDLSGAARAFRATLDARPGHAIAHFQLGLNYERRGMNEKAMEHYARAVAINRSLLDVRVNPRILDAQLIDRMLLVEYEREHTARSIQFQGAPFGGLDGAAQPRASTPAEGTAPSNQPTASEIITPSAPVTAPSQQSAPESLPAAEVPATPPPPAADVAQPIASNELSVTKAPETAPKESPLQKKRREAYEKMRPAVTPPPPPPS